MATSSVSSTSTGTITSLGVGSGLDANSIVSKLVDLERLPIKQLQSQADKIQAKISAFGQVQSAVSTFGDAARKLANPDIWASTVATSTDSSAVSFSTSSGAATGTYTVSVSSLAASQSVVSKTALAQSTNTLGSGTLTIDVGSWAQDGTFTPTSGATSKTVNIAATDTLENIRDKINDSISGVSASIVTDSSGARLVMTSTSTGAANGFRITASDNDGNNTDNAGLSSLAYDPANGTAGTNKTQDAADAAAKVNGIPVTSSTNKFSNVLTGISFTVGKLVAENQPVNVAVTQDNDTITKAITDFATSYSSLASLLKEDTKYDDATKTAGPLQADGTALSIMNQFRSVIGSGSKASSVFSTLSSIGLEVQTGGTLTVNSTKLTNALGNLSEVKKLFAYADMTGSGNDGIATKLRTLADSITGFDGALSSRTDGLKKEIDSNQKSQDELDARATLYEQRLRAQYTALDTTMAQLNNTSSYVTRMLTSSNSA